jgi:hypothetical protein
MEQQTDLFDLEKGRELKEEGMAAATSTKADRLFMARQIAKRMPGARTSGITSDDVWREMTARGIYEDLGNAAGSLFKGGEWRWTGQYRQTTKVTNHARRVMVWVLK